MAIESGSNDGRNFETEPRLSEIIKIDTSTIQKARSVEPICQKDKCPKRPVLFVREHTFLKRNPTIITCPNCLQAVETIVERQNTLTTHLSALSLLPVCLCVLPYCSKMLRDSLHKCPSCGIYLGSCFASAREAVVVGCTSQPEQNVNGNTVIQDNDDQFF